MDKINEWIKENYIYNGYMYSVKKRLECKDGFSISIQSNQFMYCQPREDNAFPYTKVELGFPSEIDELIEIYSEMPGSKETIYRYVPIEIVEQLVEKHGGIIN